MAVLERREFTHSIVEHYEEGYVCHILLTAMNEHQAQEAVDATREFTDRDDGRKYMLVDLKYRGVLSRKARRVFEHRGYQRNVVFAFVSGSKLHAMAIRFFLSLNRSDYISNVFSNREDASSWLMMQMEQEA